MIFFDNVEDCQKYWERKFDKQSNCILAYQVALLNIALNSNNAGEIKVILITLRNRLIELGIDEEAAHYYVPDVI